MENANVKLVKNAVFQGDVFFQRVDEIPQDAVARKEGDNIVAHSETGHNHVAVAERVRVFDMPNDQLTSFLDILGSPADIVHERSFDTHQTVRLPPGKWLVRRQREHAPEGWRRVSD